MSCGPLIVPDWAVWVVGAFVLDGLIRFPALYPRFPLPIQQLHDIGNLPGTRDDASSHGQVFTMGCLWGE